MCSTILIPFTQKCIAMFLISWKMCSTVRGLGRVQRLVHLPYFTEFFTKFLTELLYWMAVSKLSMRIVNFRLTAFPFEGSVWHTWKENYIHIVETEEKDTHRLFKKVFESFTTSTNSPTEFSIYNDHRMEKFQRRIFFCNVITEKKFLMVDLGEKLQFHLCIPVGKNKNRFFYK